MVIHPTGKRPAFTLVELLVVIAIIGILVALLLPAVQAAREAARRTQCTNNLKQFGVALHNYHDTYRTFPSGYIRSTGSRGWGWGALTLPFIEQQNVHDALGIGAGAAVPSSPNNDTKTVISAFICPSDPSGNLNLDRGGHAKSNYQGVYGSVKPNPDPNTGPGNGMFFERSNIGFHSITDGSSNTLAVGEIGWDGNTGSNSKLGGGVWIGYYDDGKYGGVFFIGNSTPNFRINGTEKHAFNSRHPGGANFLRADASVRFISETINGQTWEDLAQRNDGNPVGDY
jgi:prepilin-type N-terminal cleavage/methylation domain-containing protein/prepilin-type processing-associated H-X9-DG protein